MNKTSILISIIVCLVMYATTETIMARHVSASPQDAAVKEQSSPAPLTPEEEREAREIARVFEQRLQADGDFAPLIKDYFIPDFAERMKAEGTGFFLLCALNEKVAETLDADEVLRGYTADMNFLTSAMQYQLIGMVERHLSGQKADENELSFETMFPPSVMDVLLSNPAFAKAFEEEKEQQQRQEAATRSEADEMREEKIDDGDEIKTREEWRSMVEVYERGNIEFRAHLKTRKPISWAEAQSLLRRSDDGAAESDEKDEAHPRAYSVERESYFGYPKGTRLICINIMHFHMDLTRIGERLKVITVYLADD